MDLIAAYCTLTNEPETNDDSAHGSAYSHYLEGILELISFYIIVEIIRANRLKKYRRMEKISNG